MKEELIDRIVVVSEGNPGALSVCVQFIQNFGEMGFYVLEKSGLHGSDIWCFYKDECQEDITKMLVVLTTRDEHKN